MECMAQGVYEGRDDIMDLRSEREERPSVRRGFRDSVSWVVTNIMEGGEGGRILFIGMVVVEVARL